MTIKWRYKLFFTKNKNKNAISGNSAQNDSKMQKHETFGHKYVGIDCNIVRFC